MVAPPPISHVVIAQRADLPDPGWRAASRGFPWGWNWAWRGPGWWAGAWAFPWNRAEYVGPCYQWVYPAAGGPYCALPYSRAF